MFRGHWEKNNLESKPRESKYPRKQPNCSLAVLMFAVYPIQYRDGG